MALDLVILVLGEKERIALPKNLSFSVTQEYDSKYGGGRYSKEKFPFMTYQTGVWLYLAKTEDDILGSSGICEGMFDYPKENIVYPYWTWNEGTKYCMAPLEIYPEYKEEIRIFMEYLLEQSTEKRLLLLARVQNTEEETVCGTLSLKKFFYMLDRQQILLDICYVISDKYTAISENTFETFDEEVDQ